MIQNIINNSLYGEMILLFLMVAYMFMRIIQRKKQKQMGWNNFEFWVVFNLTDYFKFLWYPNPWERAEQELKRIQEDVREECGI